MKHNELVQVKDVMKSEFDMVDGLLTVADALRQAKHLETECLIVNRRNDDDEYLKDLKETNPAEKSINITGIKTDEEAEHVRKFLIATGAICKNLGELSAFWTKNEGVVKMLEDYSPEEHKLVIEFFKGKQKEFDDA